MKLEQKLRDLADIIYYKTVFETTPQTEAKVDALLAKQEAFSKIVQVYIDATVTLLSKRVESYKEVYKDPEIFKLDLDEIIKELNIITKNQIEVILRKHYFQYFGLVPTEEDYENRIKKSLEGKFNNILSPPIAEIRAAQMRLDINKTPIKISPPVIPLPDFSFIRDSDFKDIVTKDYTELIGLDPEQAQKSMIILSGTIIEALLIDALVDDGMAYSTVSSQTFNTFIHSSKSKGIIIHDQLTHILRQFRNLAHPAKQKDDKARFVLSRQTALHSVAALNVIIEEVRAWYNRKYPPATPPAPSIPATPTIP